MNVRQDERPRWTIQEAERLMLSLKGVLSARVVARPGGEVEEIHLLTTDEVKPKQTVRNVESALLSYFDLPVDHRKISVAQTDRTRPVAELPVPNLQVLDGAGAPARVPEPIAGRLLFYDHHLESEPTRRLRHRVEIEWNGERFGGEAVAPDVQRAKLEAVCEATLRALEAATHAGLGDDRRKVSLALDGVKVVEAFDRSYVLVAVHAITGRHITPLSGAIPITGSPDRAAILATLQATDRWVRGRLL